MTHTLLTAMALVFVFEGLLPFINPGSYKRTMLQVIKMPEQNIRLFGFFSMLGGVIMLYIVN